MINTLDSIPLVDKASFIANRRSIFVGIIASSIVFIMLYLLMLYNEQMFHTFAEMFRVNVAFSMFLFTWNSRKLWDNTYLLNIGLAFPFIGILDLLHYMNFEGVGFGANDYTQSMSLQFYLMARFIWGLAFFLPVFIGRKLLKPVFVVSGYAVLTSLWILCVTAWDIIPPFTNPDTGQTITKFLSQLIVVVELGLVLYLYLKRHNDFAIGIWIRLICAIAFTLASEVIHLMELNFSGITVVTHFLSIVSYYFIYRAIIVTGLNEPFNVVFHNLKRSEQEKDHLVTDLRKALEQVKTLSGFIPICINCKKIRDDEGYWQLVEEYIRNHSDAEFSHAICPDCMEKLYPDYKEGASGNTANQSGETSHRK